MLQSIRLPAKGSDAKPLENPRSAADGCGAPGTVDLDPAEQLRAIVRQLAAAGITRPALDHQLLAEHARMGRPLRDPLAIVTAVCGPYTPPRRSQADVDRDLPTWRPPASWQTAPARDAGVRTPAEARRQRRGGRLAGRLREHREQIVGAIREPMMEIIRETLAADLPAAVEFIIGSRSGEAARQ